MHGLPPPKGPMNNDPFQWMKGLSSFVKHALKKDQGLWLIVGPTGFALAYAAAMVAKKCAYDSNIIIPLPWVNPNRYENSFDKDTNKLLVPCNVSDSMKDSFKNRYKYFKRPEDIE